MTLVPDQMEAALKQNINLKIEVQQHSIEMKKLRKLMLELERELKKLQRVQVGRRTMNASLRGSSRNARGS